MSRSCLERPRAAAFRVIELAGVLCLNRQMGVALYTRLRSIDVHIIYYEKPTLRVLPRQEALQL